VEIADSARKHDISDQDIEHAIRNPLASSLAKGETSSSELTALASCWRW